MNRDAGRILLTTLRRTRIGWAELAIWGLLLAGFETSAAWFVLRSGAPPKPDLALVWPLLARFALVGPLLAGFALALCSGLLASAWMPMRHLPMLLLGPRSGAAQRCAMAWAGAVLWLLFGAPALCAAVAISAQPGSGLSWPAVMLWALGAPLGLVASVWAFFVLPARYPWTTKMPIPMMPLVFILPSLLEGAGEQWHAVLTAASGLTGLLWAVWVLPRAAKELCATSITSPADGTHQVLRGLMGRTQQVKKVHVDARWLASPSIALNPASFALTMLFMAAAFLVVLPKFGLMLPGPMVMTLLMAGSGTWLSGAWASPRWTLLPGGPTRRTLVWRIAGQSLRNSTTQALSNASVFTVVGILGTPHGWHVWLSGAIDGAALLLIGGSLAAAILPSCRSSPCKLIVPAATWLAGILLIHWLHLQAFDEIGETWQPQMLVQSALFFLACITLALLALAASARTWARYDWSRMSPTPASQATLIRVADGGRRAA